MYDGVLDMQFPSGTEVVGYANDLVLLVPCTSTEAVQAAAEEAVAQVQ